MKNVAVFDFDGTIIPGDSVVALMLFAYRRRRLSLPGLLRAGVCSLLYMCKLMDAMRAKRVAHSFLSRMSEAEREQFLLEFAQMLVRRARPQALSQFQSHQQSGDYAVICSASCACYMKYVAELLHADALLCTPSGEDGQTEGPNCRGEEKVRRIESWLQSQHLPQEALIAGYGDTAGDYYMLSLCQQPVLVNARRKLKKKIPHARQVRWHEAET